MSGFLKLPCELTDEILFYLRSPVDLLNTGLTCKVLYERSISSIRQSLKISVLTGVKVNGIHIEGLFLKASAEDSVRYLREIEVSQVLLQEVDTRNPGPRHIYVASNAKNISKYRSTDNPVSEVIFNKHFRHLLSLLPSKQLRKFSCSVSATATPGRYLVNNKLFELQTLSALFSPENMLTTLNLSFIYSLGSDCSIFHLSHLTSFTFWSDDSRPYYHIIFTILQSSQKTLKELYCKNKRHQYGASVSISAGMGRDMTNYMKIAYGEWKCCVRCSKGAESSESSTGKKIRLKELKVWRIDGMGPMMTELFAEQGLVRGAPLVDVEAAIGSLAFVKLKTSGRETLQLDRLLQYADGTPELPRSLGLESYFKNVKGLVNVTLTFYAKVGLGWLEALKESCETLRGLHLTSVHEGVVLTEDEIKGLGRSLQNLEMLTISSQTRLPDCILDPKVFPRLKYFGNRAYLGLVPRRPKVPLPKPDSYNISKDWLEDILQKINTTNGLSTSLRLIRFRLPGQNYLIERTMNGTKEDIRVNVVEDLEVQEAIMELGEVPKFG